MGEGGFWWINFYRGGDTEILREAPLIETEDGSQKRTTHFEWIDYEHKKNDWETKFIKKRYKR